MFKYCMFLGLICGQNNSVHEVPILFGFGTFFHVAYMSQSFNSKQYLERNLKNIQPCTSPTTQAVCHYTATPLCTAAILPSNSKRLFPIIMPFNAIRMVIRLQMKYLHDTVVWVHWCGEVRKAAGGRAEWLQPDLSLICKPSLGS